jgi:hypothetical protein
MLSNTKREIVCTIQYILIGLIAEGIVLTWFDQRSTQSKLLIWIIAALALTGIRFLILGISYIYQRNQWASISRRNWD